MDPYCPAETEYPPIGVLVNALLFSKLQTDVDPNFNDTKATQP